MESFAPELVHLALVFARKFAERAEDAEDLAQEALMKLLSYGEKVEDPVAWLYVVIRRQRRSRNGVDAPLPPIVAFDPWPEIELTIDVSRLLRTFPNRARASMILRVAGYTEREAADRLGCSIKSSEKSLFKARRRLRRLMAVG